MSKRDFLVELGTEELPPKSLFTLAQAFASGITAKLDEALIAHGQAQWFATPRRLAVLVSAVSDRQPEQQTKRLGPSIANAFDANGEPTRAALGFAASCGVSVADLGQADGPKGKVLQYVGTKPGADTVALLPDIVRAALDALPIAKRMRWGAGEHEFVRPVHWLVMLFGTSIVDAEILGVRAGKQSYGHRFHAPQALTIASPGKYAETLETKGHVMVEARKRRDRIRADVTQLAESLGGVAAIEEALLDEVTALVEWPVALAGQFDQKYLELPQEVPIATMQDHQRYFPVRDREGRLMNTFITVANIESREPEKVRHGNERVIRPRLADAAFFWEQDRARPLHTRLHALKSVAFQAKLGSLYDKTQRIASLANRIAADLGADIALAQRAAELSKCDLLTTMVGEFPELQGTMGRYYGQLDGEAPEVCEAVEHQYRPRFSGDALPESATASAIAIADKLDTVTGIFAIGQRPTGTKDPFAVRRATLGTLRIMIERRLDLDLKDLIAIAIGQQPVAAPDGAADEVWAYFMERLRGSYLERPETGITTEMFDAIAGTNVHSPIDIDSRLVALRSFLALPAAASLTGANKRIANILRKADEPLSHAVEFERLSESGERNLFEQVVAVERAVNPLLARKEYSAALSQLASLRESVDAFFDSVMVMADDAEVRANRLALLSRVRALFMRIADLSRLPG